ncbi:hypothetical protein FANTH_13669 [Fusarium anthophilum]|uniref:Cytochrome P450 n=1 Tax=Fusarium anthophilum TaxID=48485 RepID=A0A8H4YMB0_9HYPO|nr:hypothetical protein FANTH_13669 [Fusarium anthophilum]
MYHVTSSSLANAPLVALGCLFFSPLRKFPGPKLWAISYIPYARSCTSGHGHKDFLELHKKYGPIIRVGPNHLSVDHPDGMQDLRGHRKSGEHGKDAHNLSANGRNIIGANREDHQRFRRLLAHGFSAQSMLAQQSIIKLYIDKLFTRLHEACGGGQKPVNLEKWFNFTTFDIIGDLAFGEPFGCLEDATYHPWVDLLFQSMKNMSFLINSKRLSWIGPLFMMTVPHSLRTKLAENQELSRQKVRKRLDLGTERPDFMDAMIRKSKALDLPISFEELTSNAFILIIAGSETTATLMSAATYFLATHPECLAKLKDEVRSAFQSEDQIDMISVQELKYLSAVLDESLRLYPPAPGPSPRVISEGGDTISGNFIPEGTNVDIWHWVLYHDPNHFAMVEEFHPERWLGDDPRFALDAKHVFQPFSLGPRNCIGKK